MKTDRYTKVVLTIIAVGIVGVNIHFFKGDFIKDANSYGNDHDHVYEWWTAEHIHYDYADEYHNHDVYELYSFESSVRDIIEDCYASGYAYDDGYYNDYITC